MSGAETLVAVADRALPYRYVAIRPPFRLFYGIDGGRHAPRRVRFEEGVEIPDYVRRVLTLFGSAFERLVEHCGLRDPLAAGIFHAKGARFIDVMLDRIPEQKGLVAADLVDNGRYFPDLPQWHGPAVRITLHNDLIDDSATPIHELFHVFQYAYCSFNNPWFMEGLARWSQNLTHRRAERETRLPDDERGLRELLALSHEAEYFWRRLIDRGGAGPRLVSRILERCAAQASGLERRFAAGDAYRPGEWSRAEKRSPRNHRPLFTALIEALESSGPPSDPELSAFIELLKRHNRREAEALARPSAQRLLAALEGLGQPVGRGIDGGLDCECFDPLERRLRVDRLSLSEVDEETLLAFDGVAWIEGRLEIRAPAITRLNGFNHLRGLRELVIHEMEALERVMGFNALERVVNLEIANNPRLSRINGFSTLFSVTGEVEGYLKVVYNRRLESVAFLRGLRRVGSSFYLHHNALGSLEGLEALREVGASLSLSSNRLRSLAPLKRLSRVGGMVGVAYNRLATLEGLEGLRSVGVAKWNGQYRGLAIQRNPELTDLGAIAGLRSDTGHLILCLDRRPYPTVPAADRPLFAQSIECLDGAASFPPAEVLGAAPASARVKVLFADTWVKTLGAVEWLEPSFTGFTDLKRVIDVARRRGVRYLYGQVYRAQRFLADHQTALRAAGLRFVVNPGAAVEILIDKRRFFQHMLARGFGDFIPRYFPPGQAPEYPCVVKRVSASNGETVRIVHRPEELGEVGGNEVVNEYVAGGVEYATNLFYRDGRILAEVTYEKSGPDDFYVLNDETKYRMTDRRIEIPYPDLFRSIADSLLPDGGELLCCIDYKVKEGRPKIFEINVRLGFTLARHPDHLREMMEHYFREADRLAEADSR